jgi:hypothetical protein
VTCAALLMSVAPGTLALHDDVLLLYGMVFRGFHILEPLPSYFSPDYQRQLRELGITMACRCDMRLSCWHILLYTIKTRGETCVPAAANMQQAVRAHALFSVIERCLMLDAPPTRPAGHLRRHCVKGEAAPARRQAGTVSLGRVRRRVRHRARGVTVLPTRRSAPLALPRSRAAPGDETALFGCRFGCRGCLVAA